MTVTVRAARDTLGCLGEAAWQDPQTGRPCKVYHWADELGLQQAR